jgi:hypothetical protein
MPADPPPEGRRPLTTFGWQGILLTLPDGWDPVVANGDYRTGYVRLADENAVRLEIRWQPAGPRSPADMVTAYAQDLAKRARKEGRPFEMERDLCLAAPPGMDCEGYSWATDRRVWAILARSSQSGRVLHLHLSSRLDERAKGLARTVFASLKDCPADRPLPWRFYDMDFASPAGMPLLRQSLQSGCIRMAFGRRLERVEFVRVSLAEVLLAGKSLAAWFRQFYAPALKRRRVQLRDETFRGHAAVAVEGRVWLPMNPSSLLGRPRVVRGQCWHCEAGNRILICCFDGPARNAGLLTEALEGFRCCEGS